MILAMPISSWASVMMIAHCQTTDNTSHSMAIQLDDNASLFEHDQMPSPDSNDQSDCDCDCNDNLNCSTSSCSAITALLNGTAIELDYSTHSVYQRIQSLADPSVPDLLFRPPISLS